MSKIQNNSTAIIRKKQFIADGYKIVFQGIQEKAKKKFLTLEGYKSIRTVNVNDIITIYAK